MLSSSWQKKKHINNLLHRLKRGLSKCEPLVFGEPLNANEAGDLLSKAKGGLMSLTSSLLRSPPHHTHLCVSQTQCAKSCVSPRTQIQLEYDPRDPGTLRSRWPRLLKPRLTAYQNPQEFVNVRPPQTA